MQPFGEAFPDLADAEAQVYSVLVALRCAPFLPGYAQVRLPFAAACADHALPSCSTCTRAFRPSL